jgi:glycosyltransferase involved in cell wall biosynthesis
MSPDVISVVTATLRPVREYLTTSYKSLTSQVLPVGWDWQWIVQEDGDSGDVVRILPEDPRISVGGGRQAGECVTRNMCLARADGDLIKTLDADDILAPVVYAETYCSASADGWRCRPRQILACS